MPLKRSRKPIIKIGFTEHTTKEMERLRKQYKEADVILTERTPNDVEKIRAGQSTVEMKERHQGAIVKHDTLLKSMMSKGKEVYGLEMPISGPLYDKGEKSKKLDDYFKSVALEDAFLEEFGKETDQSKKADLIRLFAKATAESTNIREAEALEWITRSENLEKLKGKRVFIDYGAVHSPFLQKLRKALQSKGVEIEIKGMVLERKGPIKNAHPIYSPLHRLVLLYKTAKDKSPKQIAAIEKRVKNYEMSRLKREINLADEGSLFFQRQLRLQRSLIEKGVPPEKTMQMAEEMILKDMKKRRRTQA